MDNPLMPQASPPGIGSLPNPQEPPAGAGPMAGSSVGGPAGSPHMPSLVDEMEQTKAQHDKLLGAAGTLSKVRTELDSLVKLGDMVTVEDVIKGAGGLVAAGLEPKAVAGLLADMPQSGEALASWLKAHDVDVTAREQQLEQMHSGVRHELGVKAMRVLAAHGAGQQSMPQPSAQALPPAGGPAGSLAGGSPNPLGA